MIYIDKIRDKIFILKKITITSPQGAEFGLRSRLIKQTKQKTLIIMNDQIMYKYTSQKKSQKI